MKKEGFRIDEGVHVSLSSEGKFADFEKSYLAARDKEKRVLTADQVKQLPYVTKDNPDFALWNIRRKNIFRFLKYLSKKKQDLKILDIGCGNGFFSNMMVSGKNKVTGVDVNLLELKQAAEIFKSPVLNWYYADVMNEEPPGGKFDIITFCCSFQYFDNPTLLLERCRSWLSKAGEIHIIDSPFYTSETQVVAKQNSINYYRSIAVESMMEFYHHNTYEVLKAVNHEFKYKPKRFLRRLLRDSPFPWIMIK
jgi:ubiquinone/menaquinone biosynthesis C-methylase UbiE